MIEILRRIGLIIGIPLALVVLTRPADNLCAVKIVDWQDGHGVGYSHRAELRRAWNELANRPEPNSEAAIAARRTIDRIVAAETEGRLVRVRGPMWQKLRDALAQGEHGRPNSWAARSSQSGSTDEIYFRFNEEPFRQLPAAVREPGTFHYLLLEDAEPPVHLLVSATSPHGVAYFAPRGMAYPYHHWAYWIFLAMLVPYVLLPWPRAPQLGFVYATRGQTFAADLAGTVLYAGFVGVWAMLVASPSGPAGDFSGLLIITIILWGFACGGLVIYGVAAWYATKSAELVDEQITFRTLFSAETYRIADIVAIDMFTKSQRVAKGFKILGGLLTLLNWRAAAPTLLLHTAEDRLRFRIRNGREITFGSLALSQCGPLLGALRTRGAELDASVYSHYECEPDDEAFTGSSPPTGSLVGIYLVISLVAAGLLYCAVTSWPPPLPPLAG